MIVGYARVSTEDQKLDLQLDALKKAGCEKIFQDHGFSGARKDRPAFNEAIASLKEGDVLVVWKLDRLGRSTVDLILLLDSLGSKGINFKALNDGIDTSTLTGELVFHIMAVLAQNERKTNSARTKAGLAAARERGAVLGRAKKLNNERYDLVIHLLDAGKSVMEISRTMQVTPQTIYNEIKRRRKLSIGLKGGK